ncbi:MULTISPECIES: hypothetical protein [unclassified Marinobacter]|uniref:virion core protein, T7 gp14 family n=1 Tax=unclassified Marinobacter TaxID=83889 RepID=UPI00126791F1|nr:MULTISPECIES: hypothetical protein [unclassified Marinobacter]QFS87588.1 hypothetical protein FIV08_12215 [Marinobacter sp. THAF197a]QFT51373.1 hypothetical protein FIU96_12130 [Marinobacter sp. THAF39]
MSAAAGGGAGAVLGIGFNIASQRAAIKAASKYNKQMRDSEVTGLMYQNRGRSTQQMQIEQVIQGDRINTMLERLQAQGAARTAGAASGVTGRSTENIIRAINEQAQRALATLDANFKNSRASYSEDIQGNQFSTQSRITSQTQTPKFSWMSAIQAGIQGGVSGAQFGSGMASKPLEGATVATKNAGVSTLTIPKPGG